MKCFASIGGVYAGGLTQAGQTEHERRKNMERLTVPDDLIEDGKRIVIIDAKAARAVAMTIY